MPLEMNVAGDPKLQADYAAMVADQQRWLERLNQISAHYRDPQVQARRAELERQMNENQATYDRLVAQKHAEIAQLTQDFGRRHALLKAEYDRL